MKFVESYGVVFESVPITRLKSDVHISLYLKLKSECQIPLFSKQNSTLES